MSYEPFRAIKGIQPLWQEMPTLSAEQKQPGRAGAGELFAGIFQDAVNNVRRTDAVKTQDQYLLSTGQLDNPAELSISSTKYELSVNMLIQLRNKSLDAYQELMRISL